MCKATYLTSLHASLSCMPCGSLLFDEILSLHFDFCPILQTTFSRTFSAITMMKLAVLAAVAGSAAAFAPSNSGGRFTTVLFYYFSVYGLIQPGLEMGMRKLFSTQELGLRLVRTNLVVD